MKRRRHSHFVKLLALALGVFLSGVAVGGDVLLDVGLWRNGENLGRQQLVAHEGKSAEFRREGKVRVFVNPIVTKDGKVLLSMRVEEPAGNRWVEIEEPRILVADATEGSVKVRSSKGTVIEVAILPRRM